jgi:hypothetical protein
MIVRFLIICALLLLVYWSVNSIVRKFSLTRSQARLMMILAIAMAVIIVLVAIGRLPIHFILAPVGVALTYLLRLLPMLLRLMPVWMMLHSRFKFNRAQAGGESQRSTLRTTFLVMELEHGSGDMDGKILKGDFEGQKLSNLTREQLLQLRNEIQADSDSLQILDAYLDRLHEDWRDTGQQYEQGSPTEETTPTRELSMEILGLSEPINRKDVISAHRKLMQKLHPDRGGTDYLAKKINAARDCLLEILDED